MKDKKVSEKSGSAAKSGKPVEKKSAKKMPKYIFVTGGVCSRNWGLEYDEEKY